MYRCNKVSGQQYVRLAEFRYHLRRFLHFSQEAAQRAAVHPQQYELLLVLAGQPKNAEVTVTMVAERMFLRHNSTVELVDRCVNLGLVTRLEDSTDRRRSLLHLTARGEKLLQMLAPYHVRELEELGPKLIDVLSGIALHDHPTGAASSNGSSEGETAPPPASEEALIRSPRRKRQDAEIGTDLE